MEQLFTYLEQQHLGGMFISRPVNVKYVSHYTGEDSWLFVTPYEKFFITDPRYTEQVSYECPDYTILNWRDDYGSLAGAVSFEEEKPPGSVIAGNPITEAISPLRAYWPLLSVVFTTSTDCNG